MSRMRKAIVGLVAASAVGVGFAIWTAGAADGRPATAAASATALTAQERAGLTFSREEERMARELYRLFADKYGTAPFATISSSEQRHFDAVGVVLSRYSLSDPAAGAKAGVYADKTLQQLYDGWKSSGLKSVTAAYQVGVALEKRDIADLQRLQDATGNADLDRLYGRLENASRHHLAAFTAAASGTSLPAVGGGQHNGQQNGPGAGHRGGMGPGAGPGRGMGAGRGDCPYA